MINVSEPRDRRRITYMFERLARPRHIALASVACLVVGAVACSSDPPVGGEVTLGPVGSAPVEIAVPDDVAPAHEGTIVMAGSYPVEVVPHASGEVYAYVLGDPLPSDGTEIAVVVPVVGGARTVELTWDAGDARWAGRVRRVEIIPGPIDVVLVAGGARWLGHSTTFVLLPAIIVVAPSPVVVAPSPVVVVQPVYEFEGKHRGHGGWHGHGHGHGHGIGIHLPH